MASSHIEEIIPINLKAILNCQADKVVEYYNENTEMFFADGRTVKGVTALRQFWADTFQKYCVDGRNQIVIDRIDYSDNVARLVWHNQYGHGGDFVMVENGSIVKIFQTPFCDSNDKIGS